MMRVRLITAKPKLPAEVRMHWTYGPARCGERCEVINAGIFGGVKVYVVKVDAERKVVVPVSATVEV